jgi:hypothetical protein
MNTLIVNGLLWFSALGAGLIAGVFFAWVMSLVDQAE